SSHRCLAALAILLAIAVTADVILAVLLSQASHGTRNEKKAKDDCEKQPTSQICLTKECITVASRIRENMDPSVDPCDDFYQFSCGGWADQHVLGRDRSSLSVTDVMQDNALLKLKSLLEADVIPSEPSYIQKAKTYYASCINQVQDKRGYKPLVDLIKAEFGGWSLADGYWNESAFDAEEMVAKASSHHVSTVCTFSVTVDYRDDKTRVLKLDQPTFILGERQEALSTQKQNYYRQIMTDMAVLFGIYNESDTVYFINNLLEFETNLSMIAAVLPYGVNNPFPISRMQERYLTPAFSWKKFFVTVTSSPEIGINNLTDDEVIFRGPNSYFMSLKTLLLQTPKRTLANFIVWRVILAYKQILDFKNREPSRPRVVTILADNEMLCLESVAIYENMKYATNALYVQNMLNRDDETKVMDIIQQVQSAFNKSVDGLDWLDEREKSIIKEKNGNVKFKLSYWQRLYNESVLDDYYYNMTFHHKTYFENVVILNKESYFAMVRQLRVFNDPNNMWYFVPVIVNVFYNELMNSIEFPEAQFQSPVYDRGIPDSINYGSLASIIGHELIHGFDTVGIKYDKVGVGGFNWNSSFIDKFNNKTKCLIDQYSSFVIKKMNETIDGIQTLNENMADNSGIKISFTAYVETEIHKSSSLALNLPGINYTDYQLFFISYTQSHCNIVKQDAPFQSLSGIYSPEQYRIYGPLQNSRDFADAFNCPVGTFMNPTNKCIIY
ncbi:Membrane metallo-endopeptidase-like 1, partial [Bulinus truncatus]